MTTDGPEPALGPLLAPLIVLVALIGIPVVTLLAFSIPSGLVDSFHDASFRASIMLTVTAAAIAACVGVLLGAPAAYALARLKLSPWLGGVVESVIASPITIPHVLVGIAILLTFSPLSPMPLVGDVRVVGTFVGVCLAFFVVSAPLAVAVLKDAFARADDRLELAARSLGASPPILFVRVALPQQRFAIMEAFLVAWGRSMSEFGSVAVLAYFVIDPPLFNGVAPASVFVWNVYQVSGLSIALKYAGALLLISLVPFVALQALRRRS